MPKFAPKVLDGTRAPRADRLDDMRAMADAQPEMPSAMPKVDGTVYLSPFPSYCVQITAPADLVDPVTGRKTVGRPVKALFQEGRYVNNARDPKVRKHIDDVMQSNSRFGRPGSGADFWLAEEAVRMTQAAAKANATATLKRLAAERPDEFKALVAEIAQGDATDQTMPAPPGA
jgi:phage terminase large subunit-like protein